MGKIVKTRENAKERLSQLGFSFPDSKANFIFATHKSVPAKEYLKNLKKRTYLSDILTSHLLIIT